MQTTGTGRFTIGVFQDVEWAERGLEALKRHGFPAGSLTIMAREAPDLAALIQRTLGRPGESMEVRGVGRLMAAGPLLEALQGDAGDFEKLGIAGTMRRVGFQRHDGHIYETLTARGGVLVAVRSEPRAAEALATLHSYGGGNAAIGAWTGRV